MKNTEIFEWLKAQNYQTEREETQEYLMYFELDMPKILEDYYEWKVKKFHKPDVSGSLGFDEGYSKGYSDAQREAAQEIREHYHPK